LREEASNHLPGPWLKTVVLNGVGKGAAVIVSGVDRKDERRAQKALCRLERRKLIR
jgi:hypothetical protein